MFFNDDDDDDDAYDEQQCSMHTCLERIGDSEWLEEAGVKINLEVGSNSNVGEITGIMFIYQEIKWTVIKIMESMP